MFLLSLYSDKEEVEIKLHLKLTYLLQIHIVYMQLSTCVYIHEVFISKLVKVDTVNPVIEEALDCMH